MATTFLESGTSATQGYEFFTSAGLSPTSEGTIVHTGPRSAKFTAYQTATKAGVYVDAGGRGSFYVYLAAIPGSTVTLWEIKNTANGRALALNILATGALQLAYGGGGTTTGSTILSTATWYRISIAWTITSATVNEFRCWLSGALEITSSNQSTNTEGGTNNLIIGNNAAGASTSIYFSDIYMDNDTGLTLPGDIRVTSKLPGTVNNNTFDTAGGTGAVNERPLSETNYQQHADSAQVTHDYTLQTAATGDVDLTGTTLVARSAWIWARAAATGGTPGIVDNGATTGITIAATSALYTLITDSATYPSNAAGIGMRSMGTADDTFLYECGTLIAYTPADPITVTPGTLSLALTLFAPTVSTPVTVTPSTLALALTTFAPTVTASGGAADPTLIRYIYFTRRRRRSL